MSYAGTLARIPDDIVLRMATREFAMEDRCGCICGWAVREARARTRHRDAMAVSLNGVLVVDQCVEQFGGKADDWRDILCFCTAGTPEKAISQWNSRVCFIQSPIEEAAPAPTGGTPS